MCNKYVVREDVPLLIEDAPRVRWRGLMIDSGRHYLPVDLIKKTVDAMAAAKMNALHWHMTDDQSFPLCLDSQPQLCALSQYRDHITGAPQNYTPAAIKDLGAPPTPPLLPLPAPSPALPPPLPPHLGSSSYTVLCRSRLRHRERGASDPGARPTRSLHRSAAR